MPFDDIGDSVFGDAEVAGDPAIAPPVFDGLARLNQLAAIVIYWNTVRLGEAVRQRRRAGLPVEPELLVHISPLGWAHIVLTGEYRWPKNR